MSKTNEDSTPITLATIPCINCMFKVILCILLSPAPSFTPALAIKKELDDRKGETADYGNLETLFHSPGESEKAKEYTEKALVVREKIGDR